MARYIDADMLKERLFAISVVADDLYGMGINRGLDRADTAIDMIPTADVVPRAELAVTSFRDANTICNLKKELGVLKILNENIPQLHSAALEAVAREIFEEIDELIFQHARGDLADRYFYAEVEKLKKKYTEGEGLT